MISIDEVLEIDLAEEHLVVRGAPHLHENQENGLVLWLRNALIFLRLASHSPERRT
ncbi:MAG TPA: hypothetical protein VFR38_04100 [Gaiellaceae bacterium]|nr:hypothetical protein [Gaiellaceae bacterium]